MKSHTEHFFNSTRESILCKSEKLREIEREREMEKAVLRVCKKD